jgi:putative transposase
MVQLIFAAKYRKALLFGTFRTDVKQYMFDACIEHHWYIRRMETDKDHIHILLQYNPMDSITGIVSLFKQYSTYQAWKNHGHMLKKHYWKEKMLWSDGYFAASIGQVSQETIENYIENQG